VFLPQQAAIKVNAGAMKLHEVIADGTKVTPLHKPTAEARSARPARDPASGS
jgi:hypothetical protein